MLNRMNHAWRKFRSRGPVAGREGFTLVEILMVLMILSIGVLPIAVIQHKARKEVVEADRYTQGIAIASSQLERIKGMGFGNTPADSGAVGHVAWNAQISNVAFGLDRIVVTTSWQNDGVVETLSVTDLVSMR